MSDIALLAASIKGSLLDIAKQAEALGIGLENVAPGSKRDKPNNSVVYLHATSESLIKIAEKCEPFLVR